MTRVVVAAAGVAAVSKSEARSAAAGDAMLVAAQRKSRTSAIHNLSAMSDPSPSQTAMVTPMPMPMPMPSGSAATMEDGGSHLQQHHPSIQLAVRPIHHHPRVMELPYIFPSYLYVCNCWVVDIEAVKFHIAQYCVSHLHNVFAIADF
ncbi:hypothetical protein PVAP13_1KG486905 [Panicum virgatum]|uniref:Uncharacterized protein n=1 Tax=Panicum virgatum TaxID=38727 RepID=A0A8T0XKF7_PANVG|nr:hypothetical protein PVAP13_1KG486905 [Panicum virgatum]